MDKQIYLSVSDRLKTEVTDLKWIDYDWGQLNFERPAVAYPCALIDIALTDCKTLAEGPGATEQLVQASVTIRLVFEPLGGSQVSAPEESRAAALKPLDTIEVIHAALQGWNGEGTFAALSRRRGSGSPHKSGLKVYTLTYETRFINMP